ncbi:MAG TPA: hypothetical protein VGP79_15760 [Bryobacteraceae bacterium]|jgi:hypothetical protein|nr:hypothetical protein [Bryobacteraceae bacterium]
MSTAPDRSAQLAEVVTMLRFTIILRLHQQYTDPLGEDARHLSVALLQDAIVEAPGDEECAIYARDNRELIDREALKLNQDGAVAEALSLFYATQFQLMKARGDFDSREGIDRWMEITKRAQQLEIPVPSGREICGSDDAASCTQALTERAGDCMERAFDEVSVEILSEWVQR